MDEGEREPKISLVEMLFVGMGIFVLDFVSAIPLVGPLFNFGATQGYLAMKGMAGTYQLAMLGGNALTEFLSGIGFGWVPVDLVVFIGIVAVDHFAPQSIAEGLEKAGAIAGAAEGVGGGAAGGAAAGEKAAAGAKTAGAAASEAETAATVGEGAASTETAAAGKAAGGAEQAQAGAEQAGAESAGGGPKVEPEALGEERELLGEEGRLQKELFEETPAGPEAEAPEPESGAKKRLRESFEKARDIRRKVEDISQHMPQGEEAGSREDEEEEYREAA